MANLLLQEALLVGTQAGEATTDINVDVRDSVQVYTSDIDGTPDYSDAQGVKFHDGTLSGAAAVRRSLIGERVQGSGSPDLEHLLLLEGPDTFSFTTNLNGSGVAVPAGDGDLDLPPALRFLFEGLGVTKTSGDIGQSLYNGGLPTHLTFSRLTGDASTMIRYRYGSCLVQSCAITFSPGEAAVAAWTVMVGFPLVQLVQGVFPPFPDPSPPANTVAGYGSMDSLPAAPFVGAGANIGGALRKPGEITLTITQGLAREGNANNNNGFDIFTTNERTVTLEGDFFVESTDVSQEFDDMSLDLSADEYVFTYGSTLKNKLRFKLFNGVVDQFEPVRKGNQYGHTISVHATAVGGVAGSEFEILST